MRTRWSRPRLHPSIDEGGERQATWLELFFDLAFVASIAQLSDLVSSEPTTRAFLEYAALFAPVWFVWVGFTVYADRFDTDDVPHRVLVLLLVFVSAAVAVHVDDAFHGGSVPFALCVASTRVVLIVIYARAASAVPRAASFLRIDVAGWSVATVVWLASLLVPEPWRYWVWAAAVLIEVITPLVAERRDRGLGMHRSHIGERFTLFTLIVLGEAVAAVTAGIAERDFEVEDTVIAAGAFATAAALAWIYFERLAAREVGSPLYVYSHFIVYLGLGLVGPGTFLAIEAADEHALPAAARAALCGGVAVYLVGISIVAWGADREGHRRVARLVTAGAAVAIGLAGPGLTPVVTTLLLAAVVVADLLYEHRGGGREGIA